MSQNTKPQEKEEQQEQEDDGGIPIPPGFSLHPTDFSSTEGRKIINEVIENRENSLIWTPVMSLIQRALMLFFMSGLILLNQLMSLLSMAFSYFWTAISTKEKLTINGRIKMFLLGCALLAIIAFLFVRRILPKNSITSVPDKYLIFLKQ